jgi:hypothetical protein
MANVLSETQRDHADMSLNTDWTMHLELGGRLPRLETGAVMEVDIIFSSSSSLEVPAASTRHGTRLVDRGFR